MESIGNKKKNKRLSNMNPEIKKLNTILFIDNYIFRKQIYTRVISKRKHFISIKMQNEIIE